MEFEQIMKDPAEQIAYWQLQMDEADAQLDKIINSHDCTLSPNDGCAVCDALKEAGLPSGHDEPSDD